MTRAENDGRTEGRMERVENDGMWCFVVVE